MNTKKLLEDISEDCLAELTIYKYNERLNITDKHRKGKITSYEYVLELIYHFFEKDRLLKLEFEQLIAKELKKVSTLKSSDYKRGVSEVLYDIKSKLNCSK